MEFSRIQRRQRRCAFLTILDFMIKHSYHGGQYLNLLRMAVKDHFNLISEKLLGLASSYSFKKFGKIPRKQVQGEGWHGILYIFLKLIQAVSRRLSLR